MNADQVSMWHRRNQNVRYVCRSIGVVRDITGLNNSACVTARGWALGDCQPITLADGEATHLFLVLLRSIVTNL